MKKIMLIFITFLGGFFTSNLVLAQQTRSFCNFNETYFATPDLKRNALMHNTIPHTKIYGFDISNTRNGKKIGAIVVRRTDLEKSDALDLFEQSGSIFLPKGTIVAFGIIDTDGASKDAKFERAIIGGTGIYSGITGSFFIEHIGDSNIYKLTFNAVMPCK
jgi:hypothetical protein